MTIFVEQKEQGGEPGIADDKVIRSDHFAKVPATDRSIAVAGSRGDRPASADGIDHATRPAGAPAPVTTVDVWIAAVPEQHLLRAQIGMLSDDEVKHYRRLSRYADRSLFLNTHILLRLALSHAVDQAVPPSRWRYETDPLGKPRPAQGLPPLHFNISDQGRISVVAVSQVSSVGVDVQSLSDNPTRRIVTSTLSSRERAFIESAAPDARFAIFARLWAIKEAYAKMTGLGMTLDLCAFEALLIGSEGFTMLGSAKTGEGREGVCFETRTVDFSGEEYCVALAVAYEGAKVATNIHLISHPGPGPALRLAEEGELSVRSSGATGSWP
jgi:phosphopantetheinyl transferase